jgi:hypothetical protein
MKSLRKLQITAASALVGLPLCACNQPVKTTGLPPATTQEPAAQSTTQTTTETTAPTPTNDLSAATSAPTPAATTASSPLPETTIPTSTNEVPTATPMPSTQQ